MKIARTVNINASSDKIFKVLSHFDQWAAWSPWLIMDPDAKLTIADDKKSYEWEGKRVGSGNMKILKEEENQSIDYDLNFLKPWKSHADVRFELHKDKAHTKVTWSMHSKLPFYLFFMKKTMEAFIGADYQRGLEMLKAYVENGEVPSKLDWKGISQFDGCQYIGIKTNVAIDRMEEKMTSDIDEIRKYVASNKDNISGDAFTIYHKWDLSGNKASYTSAMPVKRIPDDLPSHFVKGEIPATLVYTLKHTGPYQYLGNAWSALYAMHRGKEFKPKKGIHPFETYPNNPETTPENELITLLHFAVK